MIATRLHCRRGTALIEFALSIPLLALIISAIFFFGWSMTNQQHVRVAGRYAAWREVRAGEVVTGEKVNAALFADRAGAVTIERGSLGEQTLLDLTEAASAAAPAAGQLADDLVMYSFPRGRSATVAAEFPPANEAWSAFTGAIVSRGARDGVEWRRGQVRCEDAVADLFLADLETILQGPATADNPLAVEIRLLYLAAW